jgi:ribosomal protein S18 acetylase RimI-like enzyme
MVPGFEVRRARSNDVEAMIDVRSAAILGIRCGAYSRQQIEAWGERKSPKAYFVEEHEFYVAAKEQCIVSYGELSLISKEIRAIYVNPAFGNRGIGSLILSKLESIAIQGGLEELRLEASLNAVPFYRRHGFLEQRRGTTVSRDQEMEYMIMVKSGLGTTKR